jgi:hypothetical protein
MSGKNRVFALAVATVALVGLSAPVAEAATVSNPSGFNNDSILNLSGNQLSTQTCTGGTQASAQTVTQAVTDVVSTILPTVVPSASSAADTGAVGPAQSNTCTQDPAQSNSTSTDTAPASTPSLGAEWHRSMSRPDGFDPSTNGFNNDSIMNLSGNQLSTLTCTGGTAATAVTIVQAVTGIPLVSTGAVTPAQDNTCTQSPDQASTSSANS